MHRSVIGGTIGLGLVLIILAFNVGRLAERQVRLSSNLDQRNDVALMKKQNRPAPADEETNDHVLIANTACVSFAELWNVMRAATPEKREAWARELEQLPPGTQRTAAVEAFYKAWIALDPPGATQKLGAFTDKPLQFLAIISAAKAAPMAALPGIAEVIDRVDSTKSYFGPSNVLSRWSQVDPEAAGAFLTVHPDFSQAEFFRVASNWADVDPEKAREWFTKLRLPPLHDKRALDTRRSEAAQGLLTSWAEKDPNGAVAFAVSQADDPDFNDAFAALTLHFCGRSQTEAKAFIDALPTVDAQRAALEGIFDRMGYRPPRIEHEGDREEKEPEIVLNTVPPWLVTLPQKVWIDHATEIFETWNGGDSARADAWLRTLPPVVRSKAVLTFLDRLGTDDGPRVFELLDLIDAPSRDIALRKFAGKWIGPPAEARSQIEAATLTRKQKQTLLQYIEANP